jgi:hypothetical protein
MTSFWAHFTTSLLLGGSKVEVTPSTGVVVEIAGSSDLWTLDLELSTLRATNLMLFATRGSALRRLLVPKTLGLYPDEFFAMGRPEMLKTITTNKYDCNSAESCPLDIPTGYDMMKKNTYNSTGSTYYDILKELLTPYAGYLSTTAEREPLALQFLTNANRFASSKFPRTVITVPKTLAVWFLRDGAIFHLNRRGVEITDNNGRCIPADVMPCPSCQWATSEHMCQPCSVPSLSVAWQVQCKTCGTVNRRLLGVNLVPVTVSIGNSSETELLRIFSGTVTGSSIVTVMSTDPAATLRNMSSEILKHPAWVVLDAPRAVYSSPLQPSTTRKMESNDTTIDTTESTSLNTVIMGGVGLVVVVIVVVLSVCLCGGKKDYERVSSKDNERVNGGSVLNYRI